VFGWDVKLFYLFLKTTARQMPILEFSLHSNFSYKPHLQGTYTHGWHKCLLYTELSQQPFLFCLSKIYYCHVCEVRNRQVTLVTLLLLWGHYM